MNLTKHIKEHAALGVVEGSPRFSTILAESAVTAIQDKTVLGVGLAQFVQITMDKTDPGTTESGSADHINNRIITPDWANFVKVTGHLTFDAQNTADARCSCHLWRAFQWADRTPYGELAYAAAVQPNGTPRPTPEMHYHTRAAFLTETDASNYSSLVAHTPWIPVCGLNEEWYLYGWQSCGASVNSNSPGLGGVENWLTVEFKE